MPNFYILDTFRERKKIHLLLKKYNTGNGNNPHPSQVLTFCKEHSISFLIVIIFLKKEMEARSGII